MKSAIDQDYRMDASSTATRTETPLRDIPQFLNQVPEGMIRAQGATSLQETLRNVPGVSYAAGEGGTQANQVFYLSFLWMLWDADRQTLGDKAVHSTVVHVPRGPVHAGPALTP